MFMTGAEGLARILQMDQDGSDLWGAEEMQAIWKHQLSAPIELDLSTVESGRSSEFRAAPDTTIFLKKTFGELLEHPRPPVRLLNVIEEFAKHAAKESEDSQLRQVTTALYYASCAARLTRCEKQKESQDPDELRDGFDWALSRLWLDEQTKHLLHHARETLANDGVPRAADQ